ncbi:hypothetical protein Ancab_017099 [Ancistrocladus abbreviatus]
MEGGLDLWEFIVESANAKIGDHSFIINVVEETSGEALHSSLLVAATSSNTEESSMVLRATSDRVHMEKSPHSSPRREKITIPVLLPKKTIATP